MIGSSIRITLIAVIIAIAIVMGFKHVTPEIPVNEGVYLLAGLIGVVTAAGIEWFISRRKKGREQ